MSLLTTNIRLIDRQTDKYCILEVYAGPNGSRVRFHADRFSAYSEFWTPNGWTPVHSLRGITESTPPDEAIRRLFGPTEDILGWTNNG